MTQKKLISNPLRGSILPLIWQYIEFFRSKKSNTVSRGARVLKNFGAPLATKFTYKMRSGGKRDVGSGTRPVQTQL
jgi:hypothetical protein